MAASNRPRPLGQAPTPPASAPPTASAASIASSAVQGQPQRTSAEWFRIYRAAPLALVLDRLGATQTEQGWQLRDGSEVILQSGGRWEVVSGATGRGALDLVVAVRQLVSPGQALHWLRKQFPEASWDVPEAAPSRPAAAPDSVSRAQQVPRQETPSMTSEDRAGLFRAFRALPLDVVLTRLGAVPGGLAGEWTWPDGRQLKLVDGGPSKAWTLSPGAASGRGVIDLVLAVQGWDKPNRAMYWLRGQFPDVKPLVATAAGSDRGPRKQRLSREQITELFDRYKQVRLNEVLERLGADPNQDGDKSKWKLPGLGNVITKGQRWKNVQTEVDKGYGGVDLVQHALELKPMEALRWMIKEFGEELDGDLLSDEISEGPKEFSPPERISETSPAVLEYLVQQRKLPTTLVQAVMKEGSVYGSHPWMEESQQFLRSVVRCVFLGPASAELRDTDPDGFKGCCTGSQTDSSGFFVRAAEVEQVAENLVAMTEAAIDALSYRALFPGRFVMSTNGAGRFLLQFKVALEAIDQGLGVRMALDADLAGDLGAQKLFNAFYVRQLLSHRLGVEPERVDEWLQEGDLVIHVDASPHQLFFNTGWQPELPVRERRLVQGEDEHDPAKQTWVDTGALARPSITLDVRKDLHDQLRRGKMQVAVTEAGYRYVRDTLGIRRDRPLHTKDWNEELKRLGSAYALAYDAASKEQFAQGAPRLPAELEALRTPKEPPVATPAPLPVPDPKLPASPPGGAGAPSRPAGMRR